MTDPDAHPRARLEALIDWERRDRSSGMRVDTGPARDLLARVGDPQRGARAFHVAGSKGKGSLCAWLDAGLRAAGFRVGRYTSPHVERVEERVAIDGEPIASDDFDAALADVLDGLGSARAEGSPGADATWFDVLTATAFLAFARAGVERWVVECGLGGRLDSTNVLAAPFCAITSIELEHTAVLGPTREAIATEKAGILWPGAAAAIGLAAPASGDPASAAIAARAAEVGAELRFVPPDPAAGVDARNRGLAGVLLELAGARGERTADGARHLGPDCLAGLDPAHVRLPGRLERWLLGGRPVVLDGAHTAESVAVARAELASRNAGPPVALVALGRDKDPRAVLKPLVGWVDSVICCVADPVRHHDPEHLARVARELGLAAAVSPSPRAALDSQLSREGGPWVLALGSLLLVGALRPLCRLRADAGTRC